METLRDPPPIITVDPAPVVAPVVGEFLGSDDPMRMIVGPVGSGKSSGCCVECVRRAIETPPCPDKVRRSRGAVVRNTYRELEDTTIKTFKEWVPEPHFGTWSKSDHVFEMKFDLDDGTRVECEILFRALDRPDDMKKLLSLELTFCYFNEWREIAKPVTAMMKTRVGRYPRREDVALYWSGIFGDTNPPDDDHYLFKWFEEEQPAGFKRFRQPGARTAVAENLWSLSRCWAPDIAHLTKDEKTVLTLRQYGLICDDARYISSEDDPRWDLLPELSQKKVRAVLEARKEADEKIKRGEHMAPCQCYYEGKIIPGAPQDFINVMVDGNYGFMKMGKPIYPEFNDDVHVTKEPIKLLGNVRLLRVGQDYGLTPAAVWVQQDPADGQYQVIREYVSERMGAVTFGKEIARISKTEFKDVEVFEGWGDPAGNTGLPDDENTTVIDIITAQGLETNAAPTNEFTLRREAVAGLLGRLTVRGRPALVISPNCKWLRKAMNGAYCFERLQVKGDERFRDHPLKNEYSHVAEALQYAMVGAGEDRRALDGGGPKRGRARVRVHLAGGDVAGGQGDENAELPRRKPRVLLG